MSDPTKLRRDDRVRSLDPGYDGAEGIVLAVNVNGDVTVEWDVGETETLPLGHIEKVRDV